MDLPQQLLLLSHDPAKQRLDVTSTLVRGVLLRAAAVAELTLRGLLRPAGAAVERAGDGDPGGPFLAAVLAAVPVDRPRPWVDVITDDHERAEDAVIAGLEAGGTLRATWSRTWSLFTVRRAVLADPAGATALRERVRAGVLGGHDPAAVPVADAVLALLAADGGVAVTVGVREQHRHREAFRAAAHHVEAHLSGFREGMLYAVAARRAAATVDHQPPCTSSTPPSTSTRPTTCGRASRSRNTSAPVTAPRTMPAPVHTP